MNGSVATTSARLFATGLTRPIWVNFFFPWDGWDSRVFRLNWPLGQTEAFVPDLPLYLNDLAWHKSLPNELQCRLVASEKGYRNNFKLEGIDQPAENLPRKYVNYQGRGYTLGSTTWSWVVNTCVVNASAWWNNSRNFARHSAVRSGFAFSTRTTSSMA